MRATQALIHLDNLAFNIQTLRAHLKNTCIGGREPEICLPVKADAYGHGAEEIAYTALENGVRVFAVAAIEEGMKLRIAGIKSKILLLSYITRPEIEEAVRYNLIPFVQDAGYVRDFEKAAELFGKKARVFLKIDSGMGRLGVRSREDALELADYIRKSTYVELAGAATHFAASDSLAPDDVEYTKKQIAFFDECLASLRKAEVRLPVISAANSGASVMYPQAYYDLVRPGILLYGEQAEGIQPALGMKKVMEFVSGIVCIKKIEAGASVSYGRTWTAQKDTFIGIIPAGYGDGLPRLLSGRYSVCIRNKLYPLAGRVCMDQCAIDLGDGGEVQVGDNVVIFGGGAPSRSAGDIANIIGTIPYEIFCGINKRVPRIYIP